MSDETTKDTSESQAPEAMGADERASAAAPRRAARGERKPRVKRPRPTFDDGALTRVFKFPSKTYPRSTYYMTSTEIIIRIKKARKKWKIVVPKKRVTSFRTNRWFAKPRWVELELTYTQAVRLGFVEARPRPVDDPVRDPVATPDVDLDAHAEAATAEETSDEAIVEGTSAWQEVQDGDQESAAFDAAFAQDGADGDAEAEQSDPDDEPRHRMASVEVAEAAKDESEIDPVAEPEVAEPEREVVRSEHDDATVVEEPRDAPHVDLITATATNLDDADTDTQTLTVPVDVREPQSFVRKPDAETLAPPATEPPNVAEAQPVAAMAAPGDRPITDSPTRRANAALVMASLALLLVGGGMAWTLFGPSSPTEMADGTVCVRSGLSMTCAQRIVTGSVNRDETPQDPDTSVQAATQTHIPSGMSSEIGAMEPSAPALPKIAMRPADTSANAGAEAKSPVPAPPSPAPVAAARVEAPKPVLVDRHDCRQLSAAAEAFVIPFGYASADIDTALHVSLDAFARWLIACPSARLTIEGHTDADGHADRNQALSMRRAEAVLGHLVAAGVRGEQVSLIGFGASRPFAPNVSAQSKRLNRRAALVVAGPR